MSGDKRRMGGWILPVIVVLIGAYFLWTSASRGALNAVRLTSAGWAGLGLMVAGAIVAVAVRERRLLKIAGLALCVAGAIMVIYL